MSDLRPNPTPAGGGGGSGDVVGPASSTDNAIARFDATTGKLIQNSSVTVSDTGNIATAGTVDGRDVSTDGTKLDGVETSADVTDETNVVSSLDGATLTAITAANTDKVLTLDASDGYALKSITASQFLGGGAVEGTAVLSTGEVGGTKFLREDGDGTSSWQTPAGGGGSPGGANTQVQFNNAGAFGGDAGFTFDNGNKTLIAKYNYGYSFVNQTYGRACLGIATISGYDSTYMANLDVSYGAGCLAIGSVEASPSYSAYMYSNGIGSIAFGSAYAGTIKSNGEGSMAGGKAGSDSYIGSTGTSSIALGLAYSGGSIIAYGDSSIALGYAGGGGSIDATANGCIQLGVGTNNEENSLSVGSGIRINPAIEPSVLRNGDIWVDNNYSYIRSNGVSVKIT